MSLKPIEVDFEQEWNKLKRTIESVICLHQVAKKEWTDRFSDVYRLCTAKPQPYPDLLYEETRKFLKDHVERLHTKLYERCCWEGGDLLELYYGEWKVYRDGISHMDKIYWYLNSQHLKKSKLSDADITYAHPDATELKLEIGESGLLFWRKYMIEPLGERLVYLILEYIEKDRHGNSFNENMVRSVIDSFVVVESYKKKDELEFYETLFEKPFLEATRQYYSREAENLIARNDCSQYMEKVLKRLDSEAFRCRKYLHLSSYLKVKNVCEDEMVSHHLEFLTAECHKMVANENRKDLNNLYKLLRPVGQGIQHLVGEVEKHFVDIGLDAISNLPEENMANSFVENLLEAHKKQRELVEKVFNMDQQFLHAVDKASSCVINRRFKPKSKVPCCSAELLAKYCDNLLRKSARSVSESDIEEKLTQSITIFRYIEDKDVFSKFYAKMLAKRLIHCLWISLELEESMVNRLKQACGHEFTSKFHRMLTDITVSQDLNKNFREWCEKEKREIGNFNFNIFILQAGAWPIGSTALSPFSIPQVLERPCSYFEAFYRDAFQGRNLTFLHHLGTCEIRIGYTTRPYIASMSTYFMAIFLLFEDTDKLTFKEIQTNTSLPDESLVKHLSFLVDLQMLHLGPESPNQTDSQNSSLSTGSDPASTKSATGSSTARTISPDSVFSLNHEFSHKRTRIKILSVPQKEVSHQQEVERTHASIEEDRKLFLQASIVRIMKARKQMKHNILVQEVIEQARSRFTPSVPMVKKCIEALMEKQYIERANAADEYSYVA